MSSKSLTFALFGNLYQQEKSAAIHQVLACLKVHGARVLIDEEYYHFINEMCDVRSILNTSKCRFTTFSGNDFEADFAISMGGDGTFLKTAGKVGGKNIPILGVKMGRLGFLADIAPDDIEACLQALHDDDYAVESRAVIQVKANGQPLGDASCALNDVAILKRDTAAMISIRTSINGEYLTTYQADGLIVSWLYSLFSVEWRSCGSAWHRGFCLDIRCSAFLEYPSCCYSRFSRGDIRGRES